MRGLSRGTPTLALKFRCVRIITPPGWIVVGRDGRGGVGAWLTRCAPKGPNGVTRLALSITAANPYTADKLDVGRMERLARLAFWTGWSAANSQEPRVLGPSDGWR